MKDQRSKETYCAAGLSIQVKFAALLAMISLLATATFSQAGGPFVIKKAIVAGGGSAAAGGPFAITSTDGQPAAGGLLSGGTFAITSGFWNYSAQPTAPSGYEADVAGRSAGDSQVQSNDVVQVQRFMIGLDLPFQGNEFQRADSAPFATRGDGFLQANDVVQAQRYQIGLDPVQTAGGPVAPSGLDEMAGDGPGMIQLSRSRFGEGTARRLMVGTATAGRGQPMTVEILADALGDESAYGFTLTYQTAKLTAPSVAIGTAGGSRFCNTTVAGQISCSVNNFPNDQPGSSTDQIGEIAAGNDQVLVKITFTVAAAAPAGPTAIDFTVINASNDAAAALAITGVNGSVTVTGTTAASVMVSGRVASQQGRAIANAEVRMVDESGRVRVSRTSAFGYYSFVDIEAGHTYAVSAAARNFTFSGPPKIVPVYDSMTDVDLIADN